MEPGNLLQDIFAGAIWDGIKRLGKWMAGAGIVTALVGVVQRVRSGALDWWVLGSIFLGSLILLYLTSEPTGVSSPLTYSAPEEQIKPLDPKNPGQQKRLEFEQLLRKQELEWHRPRPGGFTQDEYSRLRQEFLKIPRPCVFKITAPPENLDVFYDLRELVITSLLYRLDSTKEFIIEPCTVLKDPKDENPRLYADQLEYRPEGIIVVDSSPSNSEKANFVARALRIGTGLQVRPESNLPPDGPENLIHIRVGKRAMRGFETTKSE